MKTAIEGHLTPNTKKKEVNCPSTELMGKGTQTPKLNKLSSV